MHIERIGRMEAQRIPHKILQYVKRGVGKDDLKRNTGTFDVAQFRNEEDEQ